MVPDVKGGTLKFRSLRSFPGSKTLLIALAWGVVTAILPALASDAGRPLSGVFAFVWATSLVFCRTAFFDVLDMQGDRIVGKETIPILIGQKRAFKLLKFCLGIGVVLLLLAGVTGVLTSLSYLLVIPSLLLLGVIYAHENGNILPGMPMEFKVESLLVLCGAIAFFSMFFL